MDKSLWVQVGTDIGLVMIGALTIWYKTIHEHFARRRMRRRQTIHVNRFHEIAINDMQIHSLLSACRISQRANRVSLLRYHNGDYYIDGSPIQKVNCTHESVRPGVAHLVVEAAPVSTMTIGLDVLIKSPGKLYTVNTMPDDRFRRLLEAMGTKTIAGCPIMVGKTQMTGIMLVCWDINVDDAPEAFSAAVSQTAREIGNEIVKMQLAGE